MDKKKRPLGRSATIVCAVFVVLLCAILSVVSYRIYTATMYNRYREEMQSIVNYLESCIDPDDMSLCAQTFEESEKYKENRILFDHFIDKA